MSGSCFTGASRSKWWTRRFWGGLTVEHGADLVDRLITTVSTKAGVGIRYGARDWPLMKEVESRVQVAKTAEDVLDADAVVLAAGGFESNPAWRARYLGPGWDLARVRGTRFNTGDGIQMGIDVGAATRGHWSGCHAVGWDANAPEFGDLAVGDGFQKHSYPFGIMVNTRGVRFVAKGLFQLHLRQIRPVLRQPGQLAWQIFDAKVKHLRRQYRIRQVTKFSADDCCVGEPTRRRRRGVVSNSAGFQCRDRCDDAVRSNAQGRPCHARHRLAEKQLGERARYAAFQRMR